jgi:hypothetical protein
VRAYKSTLGSNPDHIAIDRAWTFWVQHHPSCKEDKGDRTRGRGSPWYVEGYVDEDPDIIVQFSLWVNTSLISG